MLFRGGRVHAEMESGGGAPLNGRQARLECPSQRRVSPCCPRAGPASSQASAANDLVDKCLLSFLFILHGQKKRAMFLCVLGNNRCENVKLLTACDQMERIRGQTRVSFGQNYRSK